MIVDSHTHLWQAPNQLGEQAAQWLRQKFREPWTKPDASTSAFDDAMDTVHHALILGLRSQMLGSCISSKEVARYAARAPGKYLGLAGIDPMEPGYLGMIDEAVSLGLVGVVISPSAQGFHPSHTRAMRLYERCQEIGLPVVVHSGTHLGPGTMLEHAQPHLFDEPAREFPKLKLLLTQVGHPWTDSALVMLGKHQSLYADLSDVTARPWQLYNTLVAAHQLGVAEQLLLGSDFPFSTPEKTIHAIYSVNSLAHGTNLPVIPREVLRGIVERNALDCLGIPRPEVADPSTAPGASRSDFPPPQAQVTISAPTPASVESTV